MPEFPFEYDTALLFNTDNLNAFFDDFVEVIFFNPNDFTQEKALEKAQEVISGLPYRDAIKQPVLTDIKEAYIKSNPNFIQQPEEEDAYHYTIKDDKKAMCVWEVAMVHK